MCIRDRSYTLLTYSPHNRDVANWIWKCCIFNNTISWSLWKFIHYLYFIAWWYRSRLGKVFRIKSCIGLVFEVSKYRLFMVCFRFYWKILVASIGKALSLSHCNKTKFDWLFSKMGYLFFFVGSTVGLLKKSYICTTHYRNYGKE